MTVSRFAARRRGPRYSQSPQCVPSRSAMMVGLRTDQIEVYDNFVVPSPSSNPFRPALKNYATTLIDSGATPHASRATPRGPCALRYAGHCIDQRHCVGPGPKVREGILTRRVRGLRAVAMRWVAAVPTRGTLVLPLVEPVPDTRREMAVASRGAFSILSQRTSHLCCPSRLCSSQHAASVALPVFCARRVSARSAPALSSLPAHARARGGSQAAGAAHVH